jgi:polysaccharide export outer membrane protein
MRSWVLILILSWLLLPGCAGPSRQAPAEPMVAQIQSQMRHKALSDQLLAQVGRATLIDYKDYKVGPEDLLELSFFGQDELQREIRVNGRGEITMPLVGAVKVAGLTTPEIEERLVKLYREGEFILNPQINVFVKEYRHQRVMITGAVVAPGSYEVIGPRTLLEMLGKAGGLSDKAGDLVHIIRAQSAADVTRALKATAPESFTPGSETIVIDLRRLLEGSLALNLPIKHGDVIYVPLAKSAYILGAVKTPGQVPVKGNLTVTQALALTQGLDPMLASEKVTIVRFDNQGQRLAIPVNLAAVRRGEESDPQLKENDIVFVSESGLKRFLYNFRNLMPGSFGVGASVL